MEHFRGNIWTTAKALGITSQTLYRKLHIYDEFEKYRKKGKL